MISYFNIYSVHLKCFASIRYLLTEYKTWTKNFNQGLNSGKLVWKMSKSKHKKQQYLFLISSIFVMVHSKSNMPPWGLSSPGA